MSQDTKEYRVKKNIKIEVAHSLEESRMKLLPFSIFLRSSLTAVLTSCSSLGDSFSRTLVSMDTTLPFLKTIGKEKYSIELSPTNCCAFLPFLSLVNKRMRKVTPFLVSRYGSSSKLLQQTWPPRTPWTTWRNRRPV